MGSEKIVDIQEHMPHRVSEVMCAKCLSRWISVRPAITLLKQLECPKCGSQGYAFETGEVMDG